MTRPKHPIKEIEKLIRDLEEARWVIVKRTYYIAHCPCGDHTNSIKCTPSNPNYIKQLRLRLEHYTCWDGQ